MNFFESDTTTETELSPARDPAVIACRAALDAAWREREPAQLAWRRYIAEHGGDVMLVPLTQEKLRLHGRVFETTEAVEVAEAAYNNALDKATRRATVAWDTIVREMFLDDVPAIEGFIALLAKYETTLAEAQAAGIRPLNVPVTFLTADEVRTRLEYAKGQLGIIE